MCFFAQSGQFPSQFDQYEDYSNTFISEKMIHPVSAAPEPKRRFIPSKSEHKLIMRIVRAIRRVSDLVLIGFGR